MDAVLPGSAGALTARLRAAGCVYAEEEAALLLEAATSPAELESMTVRRVDGEPLEQILGWAAFAGLRVRLLPGVFVPRRRSELMVRLAVDRLDARRGGVVLDLGCGSGALGAAVAAAVPGLEVWAVDVDPAAVACAQLNLPPQRVLHGDLYDPLPDGLGAQVICANAPYVPTREIALMPAEARDHEHTVALDGGPDGLAVQRRVVAGATQHLADDGVLLIETGRVQAEATAQLARPAGLVSTIHTDDDADATVVEFHR